MDDQDLLKMIENIYSDADSTRSRKPGRPS